MGNSLFKQAITEGEDPKESWKTLTPLGKGTYGVVSKVQNLHTHQLAAAKSAPVPTQQDLAQFEQSLRAAISGIEEAALHPTAELKLSPKAAMGIAAIVERRIERLLASMEHLVGADASKERLSALLGDQHANHG